MDAGTAAPPVVTPAVPPVPATQATQTVLHPVWQMPYPAIPKMAPLAGAVRARMRMKATTANFGM